MPVRYYIQEYRVRKVRPEADGPEEVWRELPISDFTPEIQGSDGHWSEIEFLGNRALVKVRAPDAVLATLDAQGWPRVPQRPLGTRLSSLTLSQRAALRDQVLAAGYSLQDFQQALPDFTQNTLADFLRFLCSRRQKWTGTEALEFTAEEQLTTSLDVLERQLPDD